MTKHRTITGFVAVALLAVAATAAAIRSHSPSTDRIVVTGSNLKVDTNKFATAVAGTASDNAAAIGVEEFGDQSLAYVLGGRARAAR